MPITVKIEKGKQRLSTRVWKKASRAWAVEIEKLCVEALKKEAPVYQRNRTDKGAPKPGVLRDSIGAKIDITSSNVSVEFFSRAPYTKFVIHGTPGHVITPNTAKVLYWEEDGIKHFRRMVNHPGGKKNDFVTRAIAPLVPRISAKFRDTVISGLEA